MLQDGLKVSLLMLAFAGAFLRDAAAQSAEEREPPRLTREQWLAEIEASRRRSDQMRIERRSFAPPAPTEDEIAREAFQRALEDDSLG